MKTTLTATERFFFCNTEYATPANYRTRYAKELANAEFILNKAVQDGLVKVEWTMASGDWTMASGEWECAIRLNRAGDDNYLSSINGIKWSPDQNRIRCIRAALALDCFAHINQLYETGV